MKVLKNKDLDGYHNSETNRIELDFDVEIDYIDTKYDIKAEGGIRSNGDIRSNGYIYSNGDIRSNGDIYSNGDIRSNGFIDSNGSIRSNGFIVVFGKKTDNYLQLNISNYYTCYMSDYTIKIGCEMHSRKEWEGFADEDILKMDGKKALKFWNKYKNIILAKPKDLNR